MSVLPVYLYNHPVLKQKTESVREITDELRTLITDMFETMNAADGIGLAGNQVGKSLALTVIDISETDEKHAPPPFVMINPTIMFYSEEENEMEEGCLSLPNFRETVIRPELVQVKYFDADAKEQIIEAGGLLARVMQHEIDHLNGIYFFERLSSLRRTLSQKKLRRISNGEVVALYDTVDAEGTFHPATETEQDS